MRLRFSDFTLGYEDRGVGDAIVLLHAFPLDRRMWSAQVSDLARRMRVIAPDFRGMGDSTGEGTILDAADDIVRLLDHIGIERAVVAGLSMGGYVALAFARRHPGRLAGLLLADTRAAADDEAGRAAREEAITRVARGGMDGYLATLVPKLCKPEHKKAFDRAFGIANAQSPTGIAGALAALRDRPDATPVLADIRVPTVVVVGADDTVTPPPMARHLAEGIAGAELVEIAGASHLTNLEAPEQFLAALERLIARVHAAAPSST